MKNGGKRAGAGRKPGVQNKITMEIREAFKNLIEHNTPNMIGWLQRVALEDPGKALTICSNLAEYIVPRLARTEHTGMNGGAIETKDVTKSDAEIINQYLNQQKKG